jgi:hypothetical protein
MENPTRRAGFFISAISAPFQVSPGIDCQRQLSRHKRMPR